MKQKLRYLENSYLKSYKTNIVSLIKKGNGINVILKETIFYPKGGGQPSDKGEITGKTGKIIVTHAFMQNGEVVHQGKLIGDLKTKEKVNLRINWDLRLKNMRWHSAGHIIHDVVSQLIPGLTPIKGNHESPAFVEYQGNINSKLRDTIEKQANMLVARNRNIITKFVSFDVLKKIVAFIPQKLPKNKPLRIMQINGNLAFADGGTQVKQTGEVGQITVNAIENVDKIVRVYYSLIDAPSEPQKRRVTSKKSQEEAGNRITLETLRSLLIEQQQELSELIHKTQVENLENLKVSYFGSHGKITILIKKIKEIPQKDRKSAGLLVNEVKKSILQQFRNQLEIQSTDTKKKWVDVTLPGIKPPAGHLHLVTQAIFEISRIFEKIGFTRVRHPEVDWDWYAFESLNMPLNHPARDEWETFFIENPGKVKKNPKYSQIVLSPHTSNGQVREMEKGQMPIRMINIAKCYRRQIDVSHVPMFHQFEGLYVDTKVSIGHLKGVLDYFVKQFFGLNRESRIRPFHFQFTEPSFEIDISCGICLGKGCKLCKEGWLELGGAGMVHPVVLKNGGIDPVKYNGFAFGWGVERSYMMKANTSLDDIRLLNSNDLRFLEQF